MDDFEQLERLSLINSITKELYNHVGLQDSTLAEWLISLHEESSSFDEFKAKLSEVDAGLPESFIINMDRLVLSLHPKYKKKKAPASNGKGKEKEGEETDQVDFTKLDEKRRRDRALFPGLAIPDTPWQPSFKPDAEEEKSSSKSKLNSNVESVDDLMSELENVGRRRRELHVVSEQEEEEEESYENQRKRRRRSDSRSPPRRGRSPEDRRYHPSSKDFNERGRSRYNGSGNRVEKEIRVDEKPILYKIYDGTISNVKSFGCFVSLKGVAGRVEGMVHASSITSGMVNDPSDLVSRGQNVKVKVTSIIGTRLGLSMKDVDQITGRDLTPHLRIKSEAEMAEEEARYAARQASGANSIGIAKAFSDGNRASSARRLTSPERWEIKQLIASGAASAADYPNLDDDLIVPGSTKGLSVSATAEEELDIEIREDEAPFLKGAHRRVLDLSPVKIVKAPDGTLNR
ncbi:hypothetical protein BY996DRAFT_4543446, partial [Phakopsora pachyrhizi]